ncbi:hypothetical protein BVC80_717g18 [Macleaya cordata]|uniref:Uncharacterized protein n=1 Tax=Macleaya cordata TaxID=56857 RepID=A0A200PM79_MACCD|nr:hypothetical protein BVC80_717g18 [Macleaya cordata]
MKREAKLGKKSSPALKIESKKKPTPNLIRNPLTELNSITSSSITSSCSSSLSVEAPPRGCLSFFLPNSSSKNHLQRPKFLPRTPKSAPNSRLVKPRSKPPTKIPEKPTLQNPRKAKKGTPNLKQFKNGKNPTFRSTPFSSNPKSTAVLVEDKLEAGSCLKELSQHQKWSITRMTIDTGEPPDQSLFSFDKTGLDDRINITPVNKLACGSVLEITPGKETMEENSAVKTTTPTTTITPPIQASISPEIQCGSSMTSTTASCFGAGHVLSGITDKRKCRPRGILTVGEELGFPKARVSDGDSDDESILSLLNNSKVSLVPTPSEASMRWLLSPCKEEEDQKGSPQDGSPEFKRLMGPTPFHSLSSPSGVCAKSNSSSKNSSIAKRACLISPSGLLEFEGSDDLSPSFFKIRPDDHLVSCFSPSSFAATTSTSKAVLSKEDRGYRYEFAPENSPLSLDSLGSQNAICTPQSDSSSDRHIGFSWMKNAVDHRESRFQLDSVAEVLRNTSLSPRSRISRWDPADVLPLPGLNFQFATSTPPSNVNDKIELEKTRNDPIMGNSGSSFGNLSQSHMRISWREGLVSRIFDMDELDCCRWLSDEEEDVGLCGNNQLNSDFDCKLDRSVEDNPSLVGATACPEFMSEEPGIKGKGKINSPSQLPSSCAESISTDGGGLIASGDSDWTLCYKNQLFQV